MKVPSADKSLGMHGMLKDKYFYLILVMVLIITYLHYSTDREGNILHDIYKRLYYIPIILGAFRYGLWGGIGTAMLISVLYFPYITFHWRDDPDIAVDKNLEILLYYVVGAITGLLVRQERAIRTRYRQAAVEIEKSLTKLREQTEHAGALESQLRLADRLSVLGELSASLAHEVRNPLGAIRGVSDTLRKRIGAEKSNTEILDILDNSIQSINGVVSNYLSLAQPESSGAESCLISETVESAVAVIDYQAKKQNVQVKFERPADDVGIAISDLHLRQVLMNLFLNSLDAMPEGGDLTVTVGETESSLCRITVADTGGGIDRDVREKLFQPLFTTKPGGVGLGLPIVKRILDKARASIDVSSEPGKGTQFVITIPKTVQ